MAITLQTAIQHPDDQLAQFGDGVTEALLLTAAGYGLVGWDSCSKDHPVLYRGARGWADTIACLRQELRPFGWTRKTDHGLELVVHPDKVYAFSVAAGDASTGRIDGIPSTRGKGPKTEEYVTSNRDQRVLFDLSLYIVPKLQWTTWMLLFYRDLVARELRCELSLPIYMNPDTHAVSDWAERIILAPIRFDDMNLLGVLASDGLPYDDDEGTVDEIQVDVIPRDR